MEDEKDPYIYWRCPVCGEVKRDPLEECYIVNSVYVCEECILKSKERAKVIPKSLIISKSEFWE